MGRPTPSHTTVARSDDQFSKHVNGCILGVKLFNKHSIGKMYLVKVISLSGFHVKSLIKSLISKIFFSAWSGRLAQKQAQSVPVRHSIRVTEWDCGSCDVTAGTLNYHNILSKFIMTFNLKIRSEKNVAPALSLIS